MCATPAALPAGHAAAVGREWCEKWNDEGSRVRDWIITSEFAVGDTLIAEWRFDYHQDGEDRSFLGTTIAIARDGKVAELREYAVTADLYTWKGEWR